MTSVKIHIPPFLQIYTENTHKHYVDGSTISECLKILAEHFPGLKTRLFNGEDGIRHELFIYLNKSKVHPAELSRPVTDGDEIYISHVIAGG